jgi:DNA-directed RNA polymerase subunit RPC12/RpoP
MQICLRCHKPFDFPIPIGEIVICKECNLKLIETNKKIEVHSTGHPIPQLIIDSTIKAVKEIFLKNIKESEDK